MKSYVQKASGAVALAALGGLLNESQGVQAIQIQGQNKKGLDNQNLLQINANINQRQGQGQKNKQAAGETYDENTDNIANSSTDDMFAFSQIIAGGDKVSTITAEMDKENKKTEKPSNDEDQAILAFSYEQPGNAGAPVPVETDTKKLAQQKEAEAELAELSNNDATSAFAGLVQAEEIQTKVEKNNKASEQENKVDDTNLLQLFESNLSEIENQSKPKPIIAAQVSSQSSQKLDSNLIEQLQKLNLSKEQIQYIQKIGDQNQQTTEQSSEPSKDSLVQSQDPTQVVQAQAEAIIEGKEDQNVAGKKPDEQKAKKEKPIDKLEKDEQPADNDDDEKVADNHRKMAKINLKKEEIRKLEDTHQALTKDALKQAKSGASMKKVQHNLKIAKSVAKRVEDLKQQVQSDQQQLQKVSNEQELDTILPFKKDTSTNVHQDVGNIPSVQDSSTGIRHSPDILGTLLATKSQLNLSSGKKHSKKYQEDIEKAKKQIKAAEEGMKNMDAEVKEFHNHMASSMQNLMKAFTEGFQALDRAKTEDKKFQEEQKTKENQNEHVEIDDDQHVQQSATTDQKVQNNKQGKQTMLAQKSPSNKELLQIKSDNQQETINQLQAQVESLKKQVKQRQGNQENVQIKSENKQKAKNSNKMSADRFDDCDTHPVDDTTKVSTEQISEDQADVEIQQKSQMLAQGKKLADSFDSSRKATAKKTAVKKDTKGQEKKAAAPAEQKKESPNESSADGETSVNSLMEEGQNTSTQDLESQAALLVEQANAMLMKNQQMAQNGGGQELSPDEQAAQQQIASLLGQLQSLQAAAQQKSDTPSK